MKRILLAYPEVSPPFLNGGIGTYVYEVAHLLAGSGAWEVDILADSSYGGPAVRRGYPDARRIFDAAGIRLLDLDRGPGGGLHRWLAPDLRRSARYLATVTRLHGERPYDLIESPDWRGPGYAIVRSKTEEGTFPDVRLLLHLHSTTEDVHRWNAVRRMKRTDRGAAVLERYVKAHADAVMSPSRSLLAAVSAPSDNGPRQMIRCGYPVGPAPEAEPSPTSEGKPVRVTCVSRLEPRKGQDLLAEAFRDLASTAEGRGVELFFRGVDNFGIPPDGRMSRTIHRILAGTPGWSIEPPTDRSTLRRWLAHAHVCVVPSRGDNYPNVILEAAAAGCRLVCSDTGGIPDLLQDYRIEASVVPADDAPSLRDALRLAISEARDDRLDDRQVRREAFERARRVHAGRVLDAYESLVRAPVAMEGKAFVQPGGEVAGDRAAGSRRGAGSP